MSECEVYLRKADWNDASFLLELRNDKLVRESSFQTEPITLDQHYNWYRKKLNDKSTRIYILQKGNEKAGQVRVDQELNEFMISYAICEKERGKGYAKQMLNMLENEMKNEMKNMSYQGNVYLVGEVKKDNTASQKVFLALGYEQDTVPVGYCYRKKLVK